MGSVSAQLVRQLQFTGIPMLDIPVDQIDSSPYQQRKHFPEEKLTELARSIQRDGLIEPIVVRFRDGRYELIAGERRVRAIRMTQQDGSVPTVLSRIVEVSDLQARRMAATENLQREDLSLLEEVSAIVEMVDAELIEDAEYANPQHGVGAVDRVKWLLGRLWSVESHRAEVKRGERAYTEASLCLANKFIRQVERLFANLPRPRQWSSFYMNELTKLVDLDPQVIDWAIQNKLNRSQIVELQAVKQKAPALFEALRQHKTSTGSIVLPRTVAVDLGIDVADEELVDLRDVSAGTLRRLRQKPDIRHAAPTVMPSDSLDLPRCRLLLGSFQEVASDIADASVNLIFTDPPYEKAWLPYWEELAALAARVLTPHGFLVTYAGQAYLPSVMAGFAKHLQYWWLGAVIHGGPGVLQLADQPVRKFVNTIKPLLFYVRHDFVEQLVAVRDSVVGVGAEKDAHPWQQGLSEAVYYIRCLSPVGGTVLDPCLGGGTTAIAALREGRSCIGIESDRDALARARVRISDYESDDRLESYPVAAWVT